MDVTIYHNPRCSKSRKTLELLRERGIEPTIVEYLQDPPSAQVLQDLLAKLGKRPREFMRSKEAAYAEAGLDDQSLSDGDLIAAMVKHPSLIERPLVVAGERVAVGRPPEDVLEII